MIVQRYNRRLYRVARAVLRDDAEAEDVVQETYMKALANLGSFRHDAALATWLTRIALNEALGRRRRRNRRTDIEALGAGERAEGSLIMFPVPLAPSNPEIEVSRRQVRDLLEKAVDALPEPFRIVFVLRDIEDLSIEETAKQLDLKPQTVKRGCTAPAGSSAAASTGRLRRPISISSRSTAPVVCAWPTR
jgi:RNA polymerase sigma-70 factor (ECF subfamily)